LLFIDVMKDIAYFITRLLYYLYPKTPKPQNPKTPF
jgi:hypothetical protein